MWYSFCRFAAKVAFCFLGGVRGVHSERVPPSGALIVAPVHMSFLDPPAVAVGTRRHLTFMAKEELFKGLFGKVIRSLGAFPVKRGQGDTESIRTAIALLEEGRAVLIFPEGTRNDGETMLPVNRGVAMLAKRTGAHVLPVGVCGTQRMWGKGRKPGFSPTRIVYGHPFRYEECCVGESEKQNREIFASRLSKELLALCEEGGVPLRAAGASSELEGVS